MAQNSMRQRRNSISFSAICIAALLGSWPLEALAAPCDPINIAITTTPALPLSADSLRAHLAQLKSLPAHASLAVLGDSLVVGMPSDLLSSLPATYGAVRLGVSGDRTQNVLWRLQDEAFRNRRYDTVLILLGTNNIGNDACAVAEGYTRILNYIKGLWQPKAIYAVSVLPRFDDFGKKYGGNIVALNRLISGLNNVKFIDVGERLSCGEADCSDYQADRIHLSRKGYEKLFDVIRKTMTE